MSDRPIEDSSRLGPFGVGIFRLSGTGHGPLEPDPPYTEVPVFLAQNVDLIPAALDTLRYVDCALLARRITAECCSAWA